MLCSCGYLLEGREQLDADKPEFIASDVFEQEGVVLQVFIGQVVLDLGDQLLDELRIRRLPALLLQLPAAGPGAAVCVCVERQHAWGQQRLSSSTSLNVSYPKLPKTTTVTHFTLINTIRQRLTSCWQEYIIILPPLPLQFSLQQLTSSYSHHAAVPDRDTSVPPALKLPRPLHLKGAESQALPPTQNMVAHQIRVTLTLVTNTKRLKLKVSRLSLIFRHLGWSGGAEQSGGLALQIMRRGSEWNFVDDSSPPPASSPPSHALRQQLSSLADRTAGREPTDRIVSLWIYETL